MKKKKKSIIVIHLPPAYDFFVLPGNALLLSQDLLTQGLDLLM